MNAIQIPESRHALLEYGAHWSNQMGQSGHYVRSNRSQKYVQAIERPDLSWGTAQEADRDDSVMTIAQARDAILAHQESGAEN